MSNTIYFDGWDSIFVDIVSMWLKDKYKSSTTFPSNNPESIDCSLWAIFENGITTSNPNTDRIVFSDIPDSEMVKYVTTYILNDLDREMVYAEIKKDVGMDPLAKWCVEQGEILMKPVSIHNGCVYYFDDTMTLRKSFYYDFKETNIWDGFRACSPYNNWARYAVGLEEGISLNDTMDKFIHSPTAEKITYKNFFTDVNIAEYLENEILEKKTKFLFFEAARELGIDPTLFDWQTKIFGFTNIFNSSTKEFNKTDFIEFLTWHILPFSDIDKIVKAINTKYITNMDFDFNTTMYAKKSGKFMFYYIDEDLIAHKLDEYKTKKSMPMYRKCDLNLIKNSKPKKKKDVNYAKNCVIKHVESRLLEGFDIYDVRDVDMFSYTRTPIIDCLPCNRAPIKWSMEEVMNLDYLTKMYPPKFERDNNNKKANTFDWIRVVFTLSSSWNNWDNLKDQLIKDRRILTSAALENIQLSKKFKSFGIPINFLKLESLTFTRDYTLEFVFSMRLNEEETCITTE